jgi:hypothetical protein
MWFDDDVPQEMLALRRTISFNFLNYKLITYLNTLKWLDRGSMDLYMARRNELLVFLSDERRSDEQAKRE